MSVGLKCAFHGIVQGFPSSPTDSKLQLPCTLLPRGRGGRLDRLMAKNWGSPGAENPWCEDMGLQIIRPNEAKSVTGFRVYGLQVRFNVWCA